MHKRVLPLLIFGFLQICWAQAQTPQYYSGPLGERYFAHLGEFLKDPMKTGPVGNPTVGTPFVEIATRPGQLVGFALKVGDWYGAPIISSLQPIYEDAQGEFRGRVLGTPTDDLPLIIEAKPGFAVSGLILSVPANHVHGIKVVFRKVDLKSQRLISDGSYESAWGGIQVNGNSLNVIASDANPSVGICGRAGDWIAALGLMRAQKPIEEECYKAVVPVLKMANGQLTPEVRSAYLNWAENTVLNELNQEQISVPQEFLHELQHNPTLYDAMFGSVFLPDPSILQNYMALRAALGKDAMEKYSSLAIAEAVARRINGVEIDQDSTGGNKSQLRQDTESNDIGVAYHPDISGNDSLQTIKSPEEHALIGAIADFMKSNQVAALDLYQGEAQQGQLTAFLKEHHVDQALIAQIKKSDQFGEWLKNAMVLLGQRPAAREAQPNAVAWLQHLISVYESAPGPTLIVDNKQIVWPLFPIDKAPWPLLMPLEHSIPLDEAQYIWDSFKGEHGPDRFHTYGPYQSSTEAMPYELRPSKWFWDAWPDRILHGGECVPISKATVDFYSALDKPAVWAGEPAHANLISFQFVDRAWTSENEQGLAGLNMTFAQWYFADDPQTALRFRNEWAGAEYLIGLASAMNLGLDSYIDTRIAGNIFSALPDSEKKTLGVKLLRSAVQLNPFNPELWYRLALQMPDDLESMALIQEILNHSPDPQGYWKTVGEFAARYSLLTLPPPQNEADAQRVYTFLQNVPGITTDDLESYIGKLLKMDKQIPQAEAVKDDQRLAQQGDAFGELRMGERYRDGDGVPEDDVKAKELLGNAVAQKDKVAEMTYETVDPSIPVDERQLAKAAVAGDQEASVKLEKMNPSVPASVITVTASSVSSPDQDARHLVDGSGMLGAIHDNSGARWLSEEKPRAMAPSPGLPPAPAWVRFDFAQPQSFDSIRIWNFNQDKMTDRGFRRTHIYGSSDGKTWFTLTSPESLELPRANGTAFSLPSTIPNAVAGKAITGGPIKSVIIAADSADGNYGANAYGLSAVRFTLHH